METNARAATRPAANVRYLLICAEADGFVPPAAQAGIRECLADQPLAAIHTYPGRDHAFARLGGTRYHAADAALAGQRTLDFLRLNLGAA